MVQKSHATEEEYLAALWLISHAHMDTYKELKDAAQMMQLVRVVEKLCKPFRLEQVLFAWLQRNGYLDTPERRAEPREMVVEHSMCQREFKKLLKDQGMRIRFFADNHGLFWIIPQASAAIFRPAYSRLRAWVASCRPTYQAELAHLLWPVRAPPPRPTLDWSRSSQGSGAAVSCLTAARQVLVHLALELIESDDRDKVKAAHDLLDSAKDAHYVQHREHFLHLRAMHRAQHVKESSMCRDFSPDEVRGPAPQHAVHHVVNVSAPNTVHLAAATYRLLVDFLRDECAAHGASVLMRVCYLRLHILVRRPNPPTVLPLAPPRRARRPGGAYMADSALLPFAHVPLEGGGGGAAAAGASGRGGGDGREGARKAMREAEHWDDVVVRRMAGGAGGEGEEAGGKRGAEEEEGEGQRKKAKGRREEEARGRERERDKRGRKAGGGNAAAAAAAAELRADRESISRPRIPEELVQRLRDGSFAARAAVGRGAMPSVCLCTLDSGAGAGGVNGAAVSPEGKFVVGCMQDSTVLLWDLAEIKRRTHNFRQPRTQIERHAGTNKWFGALSQPGSSLGAPGSGAGGALPWPGADGVQADACTYRMPARPITGHSGPVYAAAITTDDRFVASASQDGTVRVWTDVTKSTVLALRGHNHPVWDVAWSPEGHYLASASYDGSARSRPRPRSLSPLPPPRPPRARRPRGGGGRGAAAVTAAAVTAAAGHRQAVGDQPPVPAADVCRARGRRGLLHLPPVLQLHRHGRQRPDRAGLGQQGGRAGAVPDRAANGCDGRGGERGREDAGGGVRERGGAALGRAHGASACAAARALRAGYESLLQRAALRGRGAQRVRSSGAARVGLA